MIICHARRFVYLGPPKCASTSLHEWLSQPAFCERRFSLELDGDQHSMDVPECARGYFTFASVRNPFSRAVSAWRMNQRVADEYKRCGAQPWPPLTTLCLADSSFAAYLGRLIDLPWQHYRSTLCELLGANRLDAFVRTEEIDAIYDLPPIVPIRHLLEPVPRRNECGSSKRWQEHYTPQLADIVRHHFAEDFERFGYATSF